VTSRLSDLRVARAGVLEVGGSLLIKTATVLQTAVAARLYGMSHFGAWGTAMLVLGAITALTALRLDQYLLTAGDEDTRADLDAAFTLTLLAGIAGIFFAGVTSYVMAHHAGSGIARHVLLLSPVAMGAAFAVPAVMWERQLSFGWSKLPPLVGAAVFLIIAIIARHRMGAGVEGLLAAQVGSTVAAALVTWLFAPLRPRLSLRRSAVRPQLAFSWPLLLAGGLSFVSMRGDDLVIRVLYGEAALAIYLVAFYVPAYLIALVEMLSRVGSPVLAAHKDVKADLRRAFATLSEYIAAVSVPLGVGVALFADDLVRSLYGSDWAVAVPYLQLFAIAFVLRAATGVHWQVLALIHRRSRYVLWTSIASAAFMVLVAPPLIFRYGIAGGVIYSMLQLAVMGPAVRFPLIISVLGDLSYLRTAAAPLAAGAMAAVCCMLVWSVTGESGFTLTAVLVYVGSYMLALAGLAPQLTRRTVGLIRDGLGLLGPSADWARSRSRL
jgi:lipopolysaccharide exporter